MGVWQPIGICTCHACNCERAVCAECGRVPCEDCGGIEGDCTCPPARYQPPADLIDPWEGIA